MLFGIFKFLFKISGWTIDIFNIPGCNIRLEFLFDGIYVKGFRGGRKRPFENQASQQVKAPAMRLLLIVI